MSYTLEQVISEVDGLKPNAYSDEQKTKWINSLEGRVQNNIWLSADCDVVVYVWPGDRATELMVEPPHHDIYGAWLAAQIDLANGEYTKYANSMQVFNALWGDYLRWVATRYEPAQGYNTNLTRDIPDKWK